MLITRILIWRSNYCLQDWKSIYRSMNCLQMEEICANWKKYLICSKKKNYQKIEELFPMQIEELFIYWRIICRPKNYMQIRVRLQLEKVLHLQIKKLFADWRTINRWKNCLQIDEISTNWRSIWSADWRIICKLGKYSVSRSKNYLQIKELSADPRTMSRLKFDQQIEEIFHLKIKWLSLSQKAIYR